MAADDLLHDFRPISSVSWGDQPHQCYAVGYGGVTRIECYGEPSHYCEIPWFRVYVGDKLIERRSADGCRVTYLID